MPNEKKIQKWSAGLVYLIIVLIFGFLAQKISSSWSKVSDLRLTFRPGLLCVSIFFLTSYFFILSLLWELITRKVGLILPLRKTIYYWFLSQLGKYVPGKIVFMISRAYFYKKEGFRISLTASSFILESVAGVISLSLLSLVLIAHHVAREIVYLIPVVLSAIFFFHPKVVERMVSFLNQRLGRQPITLGVKTTDWIVLNCLYGVSFFLLAGGAFFFFCKSIISVNGEQALFLVGALGLSGALGMIAFFTPSGLGVREGALFFLLCKVMPETEAAVISIASRAWMMCSELFLIAVVYGIFRFGSIVAAREKYE